VRGRTPRGVPRGSGAFPRFEAYRDHSSASSRGARSCASRRTATSEVALCCRAQAEFRAARPVRQTEGRHQQMCRTLFVWPRPSEAEPRWAELTNGRNQFLFGRVSTPYHRRSGPSQVGRRIDGTARRSDHQCDLDSRIDLRAPRKIAPTGRSPQNCLRMIRLCSRSDS